MFRNTELKPELVAKLNTASRPEATAMLAHCLDVPRWIDEVADRRPFADVDALHLAIDRAAAPLTADEIHRALQVHPRIGERADGDHANAQHARAEQAGVDTSDAEVAQRLKAGNIAYEKRFGQVFLIRAVGRDATTVLESLEHRLRNDRATEMAIVERELREIAAVRATGGLRHG